MNDSRASTNGGGDGIPSWMQAVPRETIYNAESPDESEESASRPSFDTAPAETAAEPEHPQEAVSSSPSLEQKLSLSMVEAANLPEADPDLQPVSPGRIRSDLYRQLDKAAAVLNTRYVSDVSRDLILAFAVRSVLMDLREQNENSPLVQWLDTTLRPS